MQQKDKRTHPAELYRTYRTLPTQILHNYQILVFTHVYHRSQLPPVFSAYFDENKLIHHTRQKDDFHIYNVQSEIGKRAIKFKGSILWNNVPTNNRNTVMLLF